MSNQKVTILFQLVKKKLNKKTLPSIGVGANIVIIINYHSSCEFIGCLAGDC